MVILHPSIDAETAGEVRNIPEIMSSQENGGETTGELGNIPGVIPSQENDGEFIELKCTFPSSEYAGRVMLLSREERVLTRDTFKTFSECMWLVLDNLNITSIGHGTFQVISTQLFFPILY